VKDNNRLFINNVEEIRHMQTEQIQHIADGLQLSTATAIKQLEFLKRAL
jgi:hypothetical protein